MNVLIKSPFPRYYAQFLDVMISIVFHRCARDSEPAVLPPQVSESAEPQQRGAERGAFKANIVRLIALLVVGGIPQCSTSCSFQFPLLKVLKFEKTV